MVPKRPIFMDNHSTTPVDPRVAEAMSPYYSDSFGNAASRNHAFGWEAEAAVDTGRAHVAALIGARPDDIVFTSGATESNNLAIKGAMSFYRDRGNHIVTAETEHKAVIDTCARLARGGCEVTWLKPGSDGLVTPSQVADAITDRTVVVSIMHVNNEIGVVQPIADIGAAIKQAYPSVLFHCDAAQGAGKLPLDVSHMNVDMMSLSAHKMYGPKGVGALWVRGEPQVQLDPLIDGGGHERGLRAGTQPVPLIVGFGRAAELARLEQADDAQRVSALRDRLLDKLRQGIDRIQVNGSTEHRVAGNLNVSFAAVDGESLLMALSEHVAVSSGAACSSAEAEPSYVLCALGVSDELARASIRFGLGRFNTEPEVDLVAAHVIDTVGRLRDAAGS